MIVSTTLTGNASGIIADALLSVVDWVDACLVIDTGATDDTLEVAKRTAGDKFVFRSFPWVNDFSAARNFALVCAAELGGKWAVTLDTDERIHANQSIRKALESADHLLMVHHVDGHYTKERCIPLPAQGSWVGPVHETFIGMHQSILEGVTFSELSKPKEQMKRKFFRDIEALGVYAAEHPQEPRWQFYLGESFKNIDDLDQAIRCYDACSALRGWDEESAWACFRSAECLCKLGRYQEALERCAVGLTRHAAVPELSWLAAWACYQTKNWQQAVYWARISLAQGKFPTRRIGFKFQVGLNEGPWDILRFSLKQLGDKAGAAAAELGYSAALARRAK